MWWKTETGALYTVLIEDNEPELFGQFAHFLAVNVPGILHLCILKDVSSSTTHKNAGFPDYVITGF